MITGLTQSEFNYLQSLLLSQVGWSGSIGDTASDISSNIRGKLLSGVLSSSVVQYIDINVLTLNDIESAGIVDCGGF